MDIYGYYGILGLTMDSDSIEIKKTYRKLVKKYHPDKNSGKEYDLEMIKKINIAFEVLSDNNKRGFYDKLCLEIENNEIVDDFNLGTNLENEKTVLDNEPNDNSKKYGPIKKKSRFNILIEPSLCMAFGSCEILAPHVFIVEKNKMINPKAVVLSESGDDFENILDAAQTCPTKAIKIIDKLTGRQIFP